MKKYALLLIGSIFLSSFANAAEVCGKIVKFWYDDVPTNEFSVEFNDGKTLGKIVPSTAYWPALSTAVASDVTICFATDINSPGKPTNQMIIKSVSK